MENQITVLETRNIRQIDIEGERFFNLVDVIELLTESPDAAKYWHKVKKKMTDTEGVAEGDELSPIWRKLPFKAPNGKTYQMDAANRRGLMRVLMSVPSPKVEPFKLWLAQVADEKIEETENPELGIERLRDLYKAKGYDEKWIENRLKSIGIRKELTDEWKKRGITEGSDYARLTAIIARETFGLMPNEHAKLKNLDKQNLRDHMTNLELLFSAIGEEAARLYTVEYDAQGFNENHDTAQRGGKAAGKARKAFEEERKTNVVSAENFLGLTKAEDETKAIE